LLAAVYKIFPSSVFDELFFLNIQKTLTIILSCATIPLVYLLCRKFLEIRYSLIGAFMFAFEPRIVQNATFGITDPLFILLSIGAWVMFFSRQKYMIFSFVLAGLASTVRFEGIVLFPIFLILLYLKRNKLKKIRLNMFYFSILFVAPIIILMVFTLQNGIGTIFIEKFQKEIMVIGSFIDHGVVMGGEHKEFPEIVANSFLYLGWSAFPMFIFFLPFGLFAVFRQNKELILCMALVSISGIFAYFDAYDTRYFFPVYPFFIVISLYGIRELKKHFSKEK
jgi:4-amino-4-deoxy-L-arabinose transferase-like glycosyltransferase